MFKQIISSLACASLLMGTLPASYGASFGSSRTTTTVRTTPAATTPKVSLAKRATANPAPAQNTSNNSGNGSLGGGQAIGMTRSSVTQSVRNGTYNAPANNTTIAGNPNRVAPTNNNYNNYNNNPVPSNNYQYGNNSGYNPPSTGHSTGALIAAGVGGAVLGYMLHRDNNGNVYYTNPNQPGWAYDGNGNRLPSVPQGNYQTMGPVNADGTYSVAPNGYPVNAVQPSSGHSFIWFLVILAVIAGLAYMLFFRNRESNPFSTNGVNPMSFTKNPEEKLRDSADQMFTDFQKSNKPSQLAHIQAQSTPMLFDAIKDSVLGTSENRTITIKTLEHEVVDISQEGTQYVGTVRYRATMDETENGTTTRTKLDQNWNYVYQNGRWLLAGIEPITDDVTEVIGQNDGSGYKF